MRTLYERYQEMKINGSLIGLDQNKEAYPYFCYPTNAKAIGYEESIMYCFIEGCEEMVFASNPESCTELFVYPLAKTFEDFMRLVLACGSVNPIEQIVWMDRERFMQHLQEEEAIRTEEQKTLLHLLEKELGISPLHDPFGYVKDVQAGFDNRGIKYGDEYYNVLGIEKE